MPSITITTPTSGSTVPHTFPAGGMYAVAELDTGNGNNYVTSSVTQNGAVLDTKTYPIPARAPTGPWSVEHTVSGSTKLTGCVVTASLFVNAVLQQSADVTDITIDG
jgi:hypothetical protein